MPVELKVPSVGESITEVEIGQWLKEEGDFVAEDQPVVVIETEKATLEVPAPVSGTVTQILKKSGEKAAVGDVIGHMEEKAQNEKPKGEKQPTEKEKDPKNQEPKSEAPQKPVPEPPAPQMKPSKPAPEQ